MRLARGHQGRIRQRGEPVIPLINVIFLLLIFVMLTMSIGVRPAFQVTLPDALTGEVEGKPGMVLSVASDGRIGRGGEIIDLEVILEEIRGQEEPVVLLEADRALPATEAFALAKSLQAAGARRVDLGLVRP